MPCLLVVTGPPMPPGRAIPSASQPGRADGPRLWFVDAGQPTGIVTRATPDERTRLQALTGLRLDEDPPPWWTALAPLPAGRQAPPPADQDEDHGLRWAARYALRVADLGMPPEAS